MGGIDLLTRGESGRRAAHWNDIRSRVTTHEGEVLHGEKGRRYQRDWSKKMLGKDLYQKPVDERDVERHEVLHEKR